MRGFSDVGVRELSRVTRMTRRDVINSPAPRKWIAGVQLQPGDRRDGRAGEQEACFVSTIRHEAWANYISHSYFYFPSL